VAELWDAPPKLTASEAGLRELLARTARATLPVAAAGARHTMGGHSIVADGIAANMLPLNHLVLGLDGLLHVGAGARWSEVIPFLDARGTRSPSALPSAATAWSG